MFSSSAKCPFSIILSASSMTRNLSLRTPVANCSFCGQHAAGLLSERLTVLIRSHRRPGVATSMSQPRSTIRFCFCALSPPITLPILILGGPFFSSSSVACLTNLFRCSTTCRASSRVGHRTRPDSGRRVERERGVRKRYERTGSEYARVFPEPYARQLSSTVDRTPTHSFSNSNNISTRRSRRDSSCLNLSWLGEAHAEQCAFQGRVNVDPFPFGKQRI